MDNTKHKHNNDDAATSLNATGGTGDTNITPDLSGGTDDALHFFSVDDWESFVNGVPVTFAGEKPRILLLVSDISDKDSQRIADLLSLGDIVGVHELNARSPEATHAAIKRQASRDTNWSKVVAVTQWKPLESGVWDVEAFPLETGGLKVAIHTGTGHRSLASGYLNAPFSAVGRKSSAIPHGSAMDLIATLIETTDAGSGANREPSTTCAVRGCTSSIKWPNNLCEVHRLTGVVVTAGNHTDVITFWAAERGDEAGIILLDDFSLGDLFGGAAGFRERLGEQGFTAVRNLRTSEDLKSPMPPANGKKLGSWSGRWTARYAWETGVNAGAEE
jgi:hypothetical protein